MMKLTDTQVPVGPTLIGPLQDQKLFSEKMGMILFMDRHLQIH